MDAMYLFWCVFMYSFTVFIGDSIERHVKIWIWICTMHSPETTNIIRKEKKYNEANVCIPQSVKCDFPVKLLFWYFFCFHSDWTFKERKQILRRIFSKITMHNHDICQLCKNKAQMGSHMFVGHIFW